MIKQAQTTDLKRLAPLAEAFFTEAQLPGKFNPDHFEKIWTTILVDEVGIIFLYELKGKIVGAIGGILGPDIHTGDLVANESFWYVGKSHRSKAGLDLFHQFVKYAEEKNAVRVSMAAVLHSPTFLSVHKFYTQTLNMRPLETHYLLEL